MSRGSGHGARSMVVEEYAGARRSAQRDAGRGGAGANALRGRLPSALAFLAGAGLLLVYALPGGAYDIVVRQEYGLVIWWLVGAGYALRVLPRARLSRPTLLLVGALVAYAAWTALSLTWSVSSERTTAEVARVLAYTGLVTLIASALDSSTWRAAAAGLAFAALAVCGLAVLSRLVPSAFPANAFQGLSGGVANRLSYPFGYWNAVGAWASMSMAIGVAWSAHDRVRARRAVALGLVPVAALAAYMSYSRASVAGAVVAAVAVVALSRNRLTALVHATAAAGGAVIAILVVRNAPEIANGTGTRGAAGVAVAIAVAIVLASAVALLTSIVDLDRTRLPRRVGRTIAGVVLLALVILAGAFGPRVASKAWREFRHPVVAQSAANPASRLTQLGGGRYFYWRAAVDAFKAKPVTGSGAGTFEFFWDQHGATGDFIRNAHSLELENLAELGVPGLVLIVAVLAAGAALLARARRRSRRSSTAGVTAALLAAFLVYVLQASVDWMWQSTAVTVMALGCAAIASARSARGRPRLRLAGRLAVALAAAGAIAVQVPGLVSTAALRHSQSAERAGNAGLAYAWANAAVGAEPWAASPYEQRGLVLEAAGRLTPAATDLRRAASHEPENFVHWLLLARVETERGELSRAARDYLRARRLRPKAGVFYYAPYFSAQPVTHG